MVEPGERGATRIADRVVAKIASQAAREALREAPSQEFAAVADAVLPHAVVAVRESVARVRVAIELGYPSDIGAQCGAVRRHVVDRVSELAGMEVPEVAVTVERLHSPQLERADRGRVR